MTPQECESLCRVMTRRDLDLPHRLVVGETPHTVHLEGGVHETLFGTTTGRHHELVAVLAEYTDAHRRTRQGIRVYISLEKTGLDILSLRPFFRFPIIVVVFVAWSEPAQYEVQSGQVVLENGFYHRQRIRDSLAQFMSRNAPYGRFS